MTMNEFEGLLAETLHLSKRLKVSREEALLLIIARELGDIRTHVDDVVIGVSRRFIPREVKKNAESKRQEQ